jgi:prepilin-type N-terminal cleavage/methylation domain-containing protein/prepilin-type processing-associated H-X9-DG protein
MSASGWQPQPRQRPQRGNRAHIGIASQGFTLIEVLVVVAVIGLLISILLPSLQRARQQARTGACLSQLQQLMRAALLYQADFRGRLPGSGINDMPLRDEYAAGVRTDWLSWLGTWHPLINRTLSQPWQVKAWANAPRGGRLWRYYRQERILRCPSARDFNGKHSYSIPEAVAMALPGKGGRRGLPPLADSVKHPAWTIHFADEDERYISDRSMDDGLGLQAEFADRHAGRTAMAFFDGHAQVYAVPLLSDAGVVEVFKGWMLQVAPFNCAQTFRPWKFQGAGRLPRFKSSGNTPSGPDGTPCSFNGGVPGC